MLPKIVGYVQDICCFGKCSMTLAIPALSALGHTVVPLPTAVYSTHLGYEGHTKLDISKELEGILAHYESMNLQFDAVISGFLSSPSEAELVLRARGLLRRGGLAVTDPVLGDNGKAYGGAGGEMLSAARSLSAGADLITPNVTEACMLLGIPQEALVTDKMAREILESLKQRLNARAVVLTGCDIRKGFISTASLDENGAFDIHDEVKYGGRWHGCGDLFVSIVTGLLLRSRSLAYACAFASSFLSRCVKLSEELNAVEAEGLAFEPLLGLLSAEIGGENI
ncbi:MAG: bifunctional hydroxymethylpyrimidine kinase/phosphomethylpyrimidine kinase [Eubacteriales bacterium]|nr:bifunctional hydroxymethylpyrimidine kinase/phosphomethylpyrimidine kinase [Eubacteriales bacterium]MDD3881439.1 bifunctional hydroxymethylpyrimidine kinase/phosphomethylpyrimidine kinase [Eubacteriales bacterium]